MPLETEQRLSGFTELVATAIANTQTRDELRALADEQAALRRVATLVASGTPPTEVFAAVAKEVGQLVQTDRAFVSRYESDDSVTIVAGWTVGGEELPVHVRFPIQDYSLSSFVRKTKAVVRIDSYPDGRASPVGNRAAIAAPITVEGRLWGLMTIGSVSGEPSPPGTEERLATFTELVATAIANAQAHDELTASRMRIVATADETRARIERDLHDGAQQRLITLGLKLRAAQASLPPDMGALGEELDDVSVGLTGAVDELREFARGIHPAILSEGGLPAALRSLARRSSLPVELDVRLRNRLPEAIEVGTYYVVSEGIANVAKHAEATVVSIVVEPADTVLRVHVRDDGVGGARFGRGSGLIGLKDRVETLGGRISVRSPRGQGTTIDVELPLPNEAARLADVSPEDRRTSDRV